MRLFIKITCILFAICLSLLLIVVIIAQTDYAKKTMGTIVSQRLSHALNIPITIEKVSFAFPNAFKTSPILVGNKNDPELTIQHASLTVAPFELVKRRVILKEIHICQLKLHSPLISALNLPRDFENQTFNISGNSHLEFNDPLQVSSFLTLTEEKMAEHCSRIHADFHIKNEVLSINADFKDCKEGLLYHTFHLDNQQELDAKLQATASLSVWMQLIKNKKIIDNQNFLKGRFSTAYGSLLEAKSDFIVSDHSSLQLSQFEAASGPLNLKGELLLSSDLRLDGSNFQLTINDFSFLEKDLQPNANGFVTAAINFSGSLYSPQAEIRASSEKLVINHVPLKPIKADASLAFAERLIKLENFLISGQETEIKGSMEFDLETYQLAGTLEGTLQDAAFLQPFVPYSLAGKGKFSALFSKGISQIIDVTCAAPHLNIDNTAVEGFELTLHCLNPLGEASGNVHVAMTKATWENGYIESLIGDSIIDIAKPLWPFSCAFHGKFRENFNLAVDGKWHAEKNAFHMEVSKSEGAIAKIPFSLQEQLVIKLDSENIDVNPFKLRIGDGVIGGFLQHTSEHTKTNLYANRVSLALPSIFFSTLPSQGYFSGKMDLEGTPSSLHGPIGLNVNEFKTSDAKLPLLSGTLHANLTPKGLLYKGYFKLDNQSTIQGEGIIPVNLALFPFQIQFDQQASLESQLNASVELVTLFDLLRSEAPDMMGKVHLAMNLTGSISQPRVAGRGELINGSFESHEFGTVFQNINAKFEGNQNQILLSQLSASDGHGGTISGKGTLSLVKTSHYPFQIDLALRNTSLLNLDYVNGNFNGGLNLKGNLQGAALTGQLTAFSLNIVLSEKIPEIVQTVDVTYINQPKDEPPPQKYYSAKAKWPIKLNVNVKIPENGSIKGRDLTSQWGGEVAIKGTTANPLFYGNYKIIKGQYLFNGKDFEINQGNIKLAGDLEKKTSIYVVASKDLDEVTVEVILKGPINKPAISFRSNPPLPQREILSWILFNRGSSEITAFQGSQLNESITNLETKQEGPDLLTKIRTTLGIDRIDFNTGKGESDQMSFQVGKYISQNVFVSVNKSDINRISVEASLRKNLKLQAEIGEDAGGQILLKWKQDY